VPQSEAAAEAEQQLIDMAKTLFRRPD